MNEKPVFHAPATLRHASAIKHSVATCAAMFLLGGFLADDALAAWSHQKCQSQINVLLWYGGCGTKATDQEIANCLKTALKNHPECFDEVDQLLASAKTMRKEPAPAAQ